MPGAGFSLTKWYLDCVDGDGRTAIVYWSALSWRGVSVTWHSLALYEDGREPFVRTSLEQVAAPQVGTADIEWTAPAIGAHLTCQPLCLPIDAVLLPPAESGVHWRCGAAAGDTVVECGEHNVVAGRGYAECLTLTLAPWHLPIRELYWGRWIDDTSAQSLVWIEWLGPHPLSLAWQDGVPASAVAVSATGVSCGTSHLAFSESTRLHSRSLAETLGRLKPVVAPLMPAPWLAIEDAKWRSAGTLQDGRGQATGRGWAIHEKVVFP